MFFYDRIVSIGEKDRVLEIGPGGTPHPRADEFLDIDPEMFKDEKEALSQRGSAPILKTNKRITYYNGNKFPFTNNEFDYVIASHVLEHVNDVELFIKEIQRISPKGYVEYPTVVYDYLYNFDVHLNFLHYHNGFIYMMKKNKTSLDDFKGINNLLQKTLSQGYSDIVDDLKDIMFEGFEWSKEHPLKIRYTNKLSILLPDQKIDKKKIINYVDKNEIVVEKVLISNNIRKISTKEILYEIAKRPLRKIMNMYRVKQEKLKPGIISIPSKNILIHIPDDMRWTFSEGDYYEKNVVYWLESVLTLQKNPCLYDIGANIGYYSILAAKKGANVIAFEPVKSTYVVLKNNAKLNKLKNIKINRLAISDKTGIAKINLYTSSGNNSLTNRNIPQDHELKHIGTETVKLETLDNITDNSKLKPTLIKIDIEGFEKAALLGGKNTLLKHRPVVIVETSINTSKDAGYSVDEIVKILRDYGYILFGLSNIASELRPQQIIDNRLPLNIDNVLAIHKDSINEFDEIIKNYYTKYDELPLEYSFERFIKLPLPHEEGLDKLFDKNDRLCIFDIGMCEGEDTIRYLKKFPRSKVHSFEPIPNNVKIAKKNIKKYSNKNSVIINNIALSDKNGSFDMYVSEGTPTDIKPIKEWDYGNKSSSLLKPEKTKDVTPWLKFNKKIKVQTRTLFDYCIENKVDKIDLIHMDVQGAELMVLKGAKNMLKNIRSIWLEVEAVELYKGQPLKSDVENFMKKNGFIKLIDTVNEVAGDQFYINKLEKIK